MGGRLGAKGSTLAQFVSLNYAKRNADEETGEEVRKRILGHKEEPYWTSAYQK